MTTGTSNPIRYFGRQVLKERLSGGWTLTELGQRTSYDPGSGRRITGSTWLTGDDRAWMTGDLARLRAEYARLHFALPQGVIHGDANIGNVLRDYREERAPGARSERVTWRFRATVDMFADRPHGGITPGEGD